jgi:ferritin
MAKKKIILPTAKGHTPELPPNPEEKDDSTHTKDEAIKKPESTGNVKQLLNKQVAHEFANAALYRNMAFWCENKGYIQTAKFFAKHAFEEERHGMEFANFMAQKAIEIEHIAPEDVPTDYDTLEDLLRAALKREYDTTRLIKTIYKEASAMACPAEVIAHKYLMEQTEEEQLFTSLLNLYNLAEENKYDFEAAVMDLKDKKHKWKVGDMKTE